MFQQILVLFHVFVSIALIALVLLQQGKGAELGTNLGSGASSTVFGSRGSSSFLFKLTGLCALLFFISSLSLGYVAGHRATTDSIQKLEKLAKELPVQSNNSNVQNQQKPSRTTGKLGL